MLVSDRVTVLLGIAIWALIGVVLFLFFQDQLAAAGKSWWLKTPVIAVLLGLLGLRALSRQRNASTEHSAPEAD